MSDEDIDPAELQAQLNQIQSAMGLDERYAGASSQWLLFGVLVALAAAASQYVHLQELPRFYHGVIWVGLLFGGGFVGTWVLSGDDRSGGRTGRGKPSLWFVFAAAYLAVIPLSMIVFRFVDGLGYDAGNALTLGLILVLVGLSYLLVGNALRAYYIKARDRYAFYVGGLLLVGLGVAIPNVDVLWTWGYAVLGGVYLVYALVSYAVLTRA